jgi:hypothetical protein
LAQTASSAGYLAAEHPSAFANADIPLLLLGLMLAFISEQNNIAHAGRCLREAAEPSIENLVGREHWLESKPLLRWSKRFSLRKPLIAMTLAALLLGTIV